MSAGDRTSDIPDTSETIHRRRYSKAAEISGRDAVNFRLSLSRVSIEMIASPPICSICPRHKRSSLFCAIRPRSVAISWNFRVELPELSTRTFIGNSSLSFLSRRPERKPTSAGLKRPPSATLEPLVRPLPVCNYGLVGAVLIGIVTARNLFVKEFILGVRAYSLKFRHTFNDVHRQTEAIDFVLDR